MKDVFLLHVKVFFFFFQNQLDQIVFISRVLVKDLPWFFFIQVNFPQRLSQLQTHLLLKK